jgi:hypothetical protein
MTEISFKEWLRESERTDEGIWSRIGGAAKAALGNMVKQTVKGGFNTVGGAANSALGVGQALIPGQRMAGAKRVGRGLLQAGKGVGQVALGGAPALAAAAGMPGADLAVGALAPHLGAAAAGMVPAAVQGIGAAVPAITPLAAAGQHLMQGDGPAAAKGSFEKSMGMQGWRTGGRTSVSSGPFTSVPKPAPRMTPGSGRHTKDMSDDEIRDEMERRQKGGDTKTAEKLAYVLKRRAEKGMTPNEGIPAPMRKDWDEYTKLLSSNDPKDIAKAWKMFLMLNKRYGKSGVKFPLHKSWTNT